MGCFVSMYNYIGYRLLAPPYGLRQAAVGTLSVLYLLGIFSSVWAGKLADRLGRRNVLWIVMLAMLGGLLLTLARAVVVIVVGMGLFTFGFFASHSVASSWVGRRARPPQALASALYLFFYYLGSSVVGWLAGVVWAAWRLARRRRHAGRCSRAGDGRRAAPARPRAAGPRSGGRGHVTLPSCHQIW